MITGLFTGLSQFGGIQRISCHVAAVLDQLAKRVRLSASMLSLTEAPGVHTLSVSEHSVLFRGFGYSRVTFALRAIADLLRSQVAYVAHPNLYSLALVARFLKPNLQYILATHGTEVWSPLPLIPRLALKYAHCVTAPSKFTAERVRRLQGVDAEKVVVLPWAVEPAFLKVEKTERPENVPAGKILLTVARMLASEKQKGLDTVIESLPSVLRIVPDLFYVVVGDGDDRKRLELLARQLGVADKVLFVGAAADSRQLIAYYDACDVFVMPSQQEGFGLVFLEAMARAKPVIAANFGGATDVVVDGDTGLLIDYGDHERFAELTVTLLQDAKVARQMGAAGRRRVESEFGLQLFDQRLSLLVSQALQPSEQIDTVSADLSNS
ncbi:MAG TPA: glycosyltransferase family 4 protein [Pyrinomonadaceae bacterium]|nr:glycosyltransferase family 4 protein [Pyrinomonadaceae bacterium]